ncbi:uncharacterized protein LOC102722783 [Oryza brachyantha]|uniref:Uncharacterized protein n=1 Tax=Oryza brachyantha TaxID=4533 RepID=J3MNV7_ORYBR|nr:uncharacterized protein LOC102722783 [Oryza brachyantha]XP_015695194.1 uncharacterized protein LOC102722783 [Oryza brachyantha]XP_015695195.1 uncharacterized protein LOC102722783 [Oryza brachyantha]
MDQNVDAVHGDNHAFHVEFRTSLVRLVSNKPVEQAKRKYIFVPGIPIVSVNGICYIISHSRVFCQEDAHNWQHEVIFPDGTAEPLITEDVRIQGDLAAFSVSTTAGLPDPVKFSGQQVSHNQEVYTVNYEGMREPSLLVRGRVTHVGEGSFFHDCTPGTFTIYGSPVFNEQSELVGICHKNYGVIEAFDVNEIEKLLSGIDPGMANKSLSEILQHIKATIQAN